MVAVSVIVPCYNYGHFLSETLHSVLNQTFSNWECIIVDDGSIDNTKEVALSFANKDERFKYIYQQNGGLSSARNTGIKASTGKYIQLLDADDLIETEKLKIHSEYLDLNQEIDIVYSGMIRFLSENPEKKFYTNTNPKKDYDWMPKISGKGDEVIKKLIAQNIMVVSSPLLRKEVFDEVGFFNEKLKSVEDWEFWIRCALKKLSFSFLDEIMALTLIRSHEKSMMTNQKRMNEGIIKMRKTLIHYNLNKNILQINTNLIIELYGINCLEAARNKKIFDSIKYLLNIKSSRIFYYFYHMLYWHTKT